MIIYEDTHQKIDKHKNKNNYWNRNGIEVVRIPFKVGDYKIDNIDDIIIDTKQNIMELAQDFFCDKNRFEKSCIKAKLLNIKLIFLIEENFTKESLLKWKPKKNINGKYFILVTGKQIYHEMIKYSKLYNVKFRCCHKNSTGKIIIDLILQENNKKNNL